MREGIEVALSIRENSDAARVSAGRLLECLRQMGALGAVQARLLWSMNIEGYALTIGSGAIPTIFDSASIGT